MALFSSKKTQQYTTNLKKDNTLTFGRDAQGNFIAGNENSPVTIYSSDAEVIREGLNFAESGISALAKSIVTGSRDALEVASDGFSQALNASKSSDERLSGKVFESVNLGLLAVGLAVVLFVARKK